MHSDRNSLCNEVDLDSVSMAFRDENIIWDKIHKKYINTFGFYFKDLYFLSNWRDPPPSTALHTAMLQCEAIRWEQFLRSFCLGPPNKESRDEEIISHFNPHDAGSCRIISTNITMYTYCASCQIKIITIIVWTFCFSFIRFKRLPPSLDVMLTLSKTTSLQKPFRSDCIQLNKTWFLDLIKACDIHLQC